jgi:hypothetical protein
MDDLLREYVQAGKDLAEAEQLNKNTNICWQGDEFPEPANVYLGKINAAKARVNSLSKQLKDKMQEEMPDASPEERIEVLKGRLMPYLT